ncbi:hypothetical protein R3P38DRAFT_618668 [Favolaschia claudopus]|uniref:Mid2 domain-containing protein n=1 Tax=Favolaschia claudopus TaxID=2862362 RepID=A0AAW0C9B3_9AGAR
MNALCFVLLALAASTQAETVTLWQFGGANRLLLGPSTLPMVPIGTAEDSLSTTYLYQIVEPVKTVTTPDTKFPMPTTIFSTVPRTIIVSESGWYEVFETHAISCGYVNASFGQCVGIDSTTTEIANSGTPKAVRLEVSTTVHSIISTPSLPTPGSTVTVTVVPTQTNPRTAALSTKSPVGAIVGGLIGGLALVLGMLAMLLHLRRRRTNHVSEISPRSFAVVGETAAYHPTNVVSVSPYPSMVQHASVPGPMSSTEHNHDSLPPPKYSAMYGVV